MKRNVDTYLEFINEAGKHEWLDTGIDDKGVDTGQMRVGGEETMKYQVLRFISESGEKGVRYTDIIKFILKDRGITYDHKKHRGYWATNLTGTTGYWSGGKGTGLLLKYCAKNEDGKWILKNSALRKYFISTDLRDLLDDDALNALGELIY